MPHRAYRLVLEGELSEGVTEAFEGTSATLEGGNTVLVARDQAELMAMLRRVSAFGLTVLSATASDEPARRTP